MRTGGFTFDVLAGVRYLYMNEKPGIDQSVTGAPGQPTSRSRLLGVAIPTGSTYVIKDSFNVTNRYYGGQVGTRVDWAWRNLDIVLPS